MDRASAEKFCDRWLPAWSGNEPERLIAFYAEQAFYLDPAVPKGFKGRARLLGYFKKLLAWKPEWRWRREEVIPTERGFVLKWKASIPGFDSEIAGLDIVELEDGLITRNEVYFDGRLLKE